jgi:hypothetical protein
VGIVLDSTVLIAAERAGATAPELGYAVATANVRHFEMIPNLVVHRI